MYDYPFEKKKIMYDEVFCMIAFCRTKLELLLYDEQTNYGVKCEYSIEKLFLVSLISDFVGSLCYGYFESETGLELASKQSNRYYNSNKRIGDISCNSLKGLGSNLQLV